MCAGAATIGSVGGRGTDCCISPFGLLAMHGHFQGAAIADQSLEQRQSALEILVSLGMESTDFLIIGGGIVGLSIARELKERHRDSKVTLIEKEPEVGLHASGRNSGVIHAGFYYSADSLKARFTRQGNQLLTSYCEEKKLPVLKCGKLVVAKDASELPQLDELLRRGRANNVPLESVTEAEAKKIEPRVKTFRRAIFSPTTATADPVQVVLAMKQDARCEGVKIVTGTVYQG